jgi:hypothetical protein
MTFHEYLSKAVQDDAQLAAERAACSWWRDGLTGRAACVQVMPAR